jgi:hypothetical protein
MKKILVCLFIFQIAHFTPSLFAQSVKIIDLKGCVTVKQNAQLDWKKAKIDMTLYKDAEVKTEKKSECTIAFDDEISNALTLKEDSHIKLESILPANVYLPQGRVFSLIDDIAKIEDFEIRTPTAIAGVRGTGLSAVAKKDGCSTFSSFENSVNVQGSDQQGNKTNQKNLPSGFGINVCEGGMLGEFFKLGAGDLREWDGFKGNLEDLRGNSGKDDDLDPLGDLKDENQGPRRNGMFEDLRRDEENRRESGGDAGDDGCDG